MTHPSPPKVADILTTTPQFRQRQDSVTDQLHDLIRLGQRLGMAEAAEWIERRLHPENYA